MEKRSSMDILFSDRVKKSEVHPAALRPAQVVGQSDCHRPCSAWALCHSEPTGTPPTSDIATLLPPFPGAWVLTFMKNLARLGLLGQFDSVRLPSSSRQ